MAGRKMPHANSPGIAPLGHKPFSHVKLEGPKKHHDDHGPLDSNPKDAHIPPQHWERQYDATDASRNMYLTEGSDFNPKCSDQRKTTHIKVNKEDH